MLSWPLRLEKRLEPILTGKFYIIATAVLFASFAFQLSHSGRLSGPPRNTNGDEPDYDNIACSLRATGAFATDYRDAAFLEPYQREIEVGKRPRGYPERVASKPTGQTTGRPPLLPVLLALTYGDDLSNRSFYLIRLINAAAAAVTAGVTSWVCRREVGAVASLVCLGLMCCYGNLQGFAGLVLTESLSGMFVVLTLSVLVRVAPQRPILAGVMAGLLWSAAVFTRTSAILWVPAVIIGLWVIVRKQPGGAKTSPWRAFASATCFALVLLGALLPWAIRNCMVLKSFMPLGAQGYMELPAGFSDQAVAQGGVWTPLPRSSDPSAPAPLPEFEKRAAEEGRAEVVGWIKQNPEKLPALTLKKVWSEWKPKSSALAFVLFTACVGFGCYRGSTFGWACLTIIIGDLLMIAATWSVEGRFTYPAGGALYGLAGAGAWSILRLVTDLRHQVATESRVSAELKTVLAIEERSSSDHSGGTA